MDLSPDSGLVTLAGAGNFAPLLFFVFLATNIWSMVSASAELRGLSNVAPTSGSSASTVSPNPWAASPKSSP